MKRLIAFLSFVALMAIQLNANPIYTEENNDDKIIKAHFTGGKSALHDYINEHLHYPSCARERGVEGQVTVSFYVLADGTIHGAKIVDGLDTKCDGVALNVVQNMPKWVPATAKGQQVPTKQYLTFNFYIQG